MQISRGVGQIQCATWGRGVLVELHRLLLSEACVGCQLEKEMAERERFELSREFPPYTRSRRAPSTTRTSLL